MVWRYPKLYHSSFTSRQLGFWKLSIKVKCNQNLEAAFPQLSRMGLFLFVLQIFCKLCLFEVEQFYEFSFKQLLKDLGHKIQASV